MFHDKRRGCWRVQWTEGSKRRSRSFGSKQEARVFEAQLEAGLVLSPVRSLETVAEFAERWLEQYCKPEKAPGQYVNDRSAIRHHVSSSALGGKQLAAVTKGDLQAFRQELRARRHLRSGRPLSVKTVNLVLSLVRKIFRTAVEWGGISTSPAESLKLFPLPEQAVDYWTVEERDRFLRFAKHHDPTFTAIVLVATHTGLRRGEIAALQRHQLDFERRMILVNATYCFQTEQRLARTKNRRVGWVPMPAEVADALADRKLLAPSAQVFDPECLLHASRRLGRLCKLTGSRRIRFHDLRHGYASSLVAGGVDLYTTQRLMRHSSPTMTQRYAHLAADHLHEAVKSLAAHKTARTGIKDKVSSES